MTLLIYTLHNDTPFDNNKFLYNIYTGYTLVKSLFFNKFVMIR